jgi:Type-1V conjugative transfer system mating pair stabilisation
MKGLVQSVAWLLMTTASVCAAAPASNTSAEAIHNEGKALGNNLANSENARLRAGGTAPLTPQYNPNPPQRSLYNSSAEFSAPMASHQATCAANPNDPSCAGVRLGSTPQPRMVIAPSDPALAGQGAVRNPSQVLGDISSTYSTCTTGSPSLVSPAEYGSSTCSLQTAQWTTHDCAKEPAGGRACEPGTAVVTGDVNGATVSLRVQALCVAADSTMQEFVVRLASADPARSQSATVRLPTATPTPTPPATGTLQVGSLVVSDERDIELNQEIRVWITAHAAGPSCGAGNECVMAFWLYQWIRVCEVEAGRRICRTRNVGAGAVAPGQTRPSVGRIELRYRKPGTVDSSAVNTCQPYEAKTAPLPGDGRVSAMDQPLLPPLGQIGQQQCVKSATQCARTDPATGSCTRWESRFDCMALTADSSCPALQANGCAPSGVATCAATDAEGRCLSASQTYECLTREAVYAPSTNCGAAGDFCAGGSCWDSSTQPNDQFNVAVAHLQARLDAGNDFDPNRMEIFKGTAGYCGKHSYGVRDCCNNSRDLISCSQDEKDLVAKRDAGLCHSVGDYCANRDVFGGCRTRHFRYCCFNGILGRLVQQQGRTQIAKAWGDPRDPDCSGFTINEFTALDWASIDLSDWYVQINPVPPDMGAAQSSNTTQGTTTCYYGGGKCGP